MSQIKPNHSKTILITGASDGIGKEISRKLSSEGYNLILIGRNKKNLLKTKDLCSKTSKKIEVFICDLTKIEDIKQTSYLISKKHKSLDGIINCAGIWQKMSNLENISHEIILQTINTNLTGLILITHEVLPLIKQAKSSFIINISSRSGYKAQQGQSIYTASKFGVRGFTQSLIEDLKDSNVRVSGIYQGGTNTKMFEKASEIFTKDKYLKFIKPEELAELISFLISRPQGIWFPEIRVESK